MPRPTARRLAVLLAGLLWCAAAGVGAAAASPPDGDPDSDAPRPGYTLVLPEITPLVVDGGPTRVLTGVARNAGYAIEVPPHWNGELVLWAHGYRGNRPELTVDPPAFGLRERLVGQGYAWAASSYDRNGYDVASGVRSTKALADEFGGLVGEPGRTYLAGVSMGGHVIARSLEEHPGAYDGALPMCGVLGDHELFDYLLDHQVIAQALAGVHAYPPPPDYATGALPAVYAGLGLTPGDPAVPTPAARQLRDATVLGSGGPRPGAEASYSFWKDFLFELAVPDATPTPVDGVAADPSRVAANLDTDYAPDEPADLDALVQRVPPRAPEVRRSDELTAIATVQGRPTVPVLSLHDLGDLFVPFSMEQVYAEEVAAAGRSELLVQRAIRATGHCEFSAVEAGAAWDDLVAWVERGEHPEGDAVTDPDAVADPAFGCRFSDPAAFAAAGPVSDQDTRRLYEPCATEG